MRDGRVNAFSLRVLQISHVKPAVNRPPQSLSRLLPKGAVLGASFLPEGTP